MLIFLFAKPGTAVAEGSGTQMPPTFAPDSSPKAMDEGDDEGGDDDSDDDDGDSCFEP